MSGDHVLDRRLVLSATRAEDILGEPHTLTRAPSRDRLRELITRLSERLGAGPDGEGTRLVAEHDAALDRLRERFETRSEAIAGARAAASELRALTSPAAMLVRAPKALSGASNFARVILSLVSDGQMVAEAAHFTGEPAAATAALDELRSNPIRLEHPLIETELLRRRRATIVIDARVNPRVSRQLATLMGWRSYAAAPLLVGSQVIGVLHADRGPDSQLDVLDRDVLWEFATELTQAYEAASLVRTLRTEREQMRRFVEWINARSGELTDGPIRLATVQRPPPPPTMPRPSLSGTASRDDRAVFEGLVTRRELDVLRLLADGQSNKAIAEALVISDGTVKFHVNSILRKLHAANRAEAVACYLRLLGLRSP
jgi:LuxR family transcriptional regulator, regulator of acetate metabolism